MANQDRPKGAEPKGTPMRSEVYQSGGAIFKGDWVSKDADGEVIAALVTTALVGVAAESTSAAGAEVKVYDHPDQQFIIQADDAGVAAQTNLNLNYNIVATAGDATFSQSRMELDGSSGAVTATLPLKALRLDVRDDNAFGANADVVVIINNHQLKGGTGTLGT